MLNLKSPKLCIAKKNLKGYGSCKSKCCKHAIFRLDAHYSQTYLCAVTFNNNDYGERKSKLSGGI